MPYYRRQGAAYCSALGISKSVCSDNAIIPPTGYIFIHVRSIPLLAWSTHQSFYQNIVIAVILLLPNKTLQDTNHRYCHFLTVLAFAPEPLAFLAALIKNLDTEY